MPYTFPLPWNATHDRCVALPARLPLVLGRPDHEPFCCSDDSPASLADVICCSGPQQSLDIKFQRGVFRESLSGSKYSAVNNSNIVTVGLLPSGAWLSGRSRSVPTGLRRERHSTG